MPLHCQTSCKPRSSSLLIIALHVQVCKRFSSSQCLRHFDKTEDQLLPVVCHNHFSLRNNELSKEQLSGHILIYLKRSLQLSIQSKSIVSCASLPFLVSSFTILKFLNSSQKEFANKSDTLSAVKTSRYVDDGVAS